jgi:RND family efflux transporter MFP subunit
MAAVIAVLLCLAPLRAQEKTTEKAGRRTVKVEKVMRRLLRETITTSGTTAAAKRSRLNFQVPGVVSKVLVEMGDRVSKGAPLSKLDDSNYKLYVEQASASFLAASATLDKLKKGFRPEEIAQAQAGVEAARAALEKFTLGFRSEDIKAAQAGLAAAQASYKQAKKNCDRMKKLFEEKAVAEATFEQAKTRLDVAKARRDQAEQQYKTLRTGYEQTDIEGMKARFEQAAEQLALLKKGFREEDINAATAQVTVAQAALNMAKKKMRDCILNAPYDGVVVRTYVDPGDSVSTMPGQVAVEVMDISSLKVIVPVADVWAEKITKDATALVDLDGGPKGLKAKITAISHAINPANRAFDVKFVLDNPGLKLKAGMFARVRIVYNEVSVLAVPSISIQKDDSGEYVMVYENGLAVKVHVETGISSEGYTQIVKGLTEEQPVIYEGNFGLKDRAQVELTEDSGK